MNSSVVRVKSELASVTVNFEIPTYLSSGISIKFLQVVDGSKSVVPYRWIKYLTKSESFVFKL